MTYVEDIEWALYGPPRDKEDCAAFARIRARKWKACMEENKKKRQPRGIPELNALYFESIAADERVAAMPDTVTIGDWLDADCEAKALEKFWSDARLAWDRRMTFEAQCRYEDCKLTYKRRKSTPTKYVRGPNGTKIPRSKSHANQ